MAKNNLWSEKKNRPSKSISDYEGGAEKLLQYANAHPSVRELAQLKIKAELRRWDIELRPPTIEEIQNRYNFTAEYAGKFLKQLEKAKNPKEKRQVTTITKKVEPGVALLELPHVAPIDQKIAGGKAEKNERAQLDVILAEIRGRFDEEIRLKGEQTSVRQGFVYLVKNPCFPGWVKAGMTIDYELRLSTYNTSDPLSRFEYVKLAWTPDRREAELLLLNALRLNALETLGEWFRMQVQDAVLIFDQYKLAP
jgi:hypothetical protein